MATLTFLVPGPARPTRSGPAGAPAPSGGLPGRVKHHVVLGVHRAGGTLQRLEAVPGEDVVVLHLANGPALVLHPETARDLLLGPSPTPREGGAPRSDEVPVPAQLGWPGLEDAAPGRTRGALGHVLLQAVEVLTGFAHEPAARLLAARVAAQVDGQVDPGVYALQQEALPTLKGRGGPLARVPASNQPVLVLLHGTFVDTASTFSKLWDLYPARVQALFQHYGGRVYALDHPTLGASPIANALALAERLPPGARLHLATHSRGGLVAEVLARVCGQQGVLTAADLASFPGPDHAAQRDDLVRLAARVKAGGFTVERVVRVACPARGTLLASRRLDACLSVLRWSLQLAGVPVAPVLLDFLIAVARQREDPEQLPGLAAMLPGSPLVQWLDSAPEAIPGELRVIAGDLAGDSLGGWVKTLLADAFYWTDNDLVVQTRSMYGGAPRRGGGARFVLDAGGKVTHFQYFVNLRTVDAFVDGLLQDQPAGYEPIGPLSWAGDDSGGRRAAPARPADRAQPAERPAVFLLPGLLASHLKHGGQRLWLGPHLRDGLDRLAWRGGAADDVAPEAPIGLFYDALAGHLVATHEVLPFAWDWRRPIEDEALRLAQALAHELDLRTASGQPVRLLAHSVGGLLARTVQLVAPQTWDRLLARPGGRLLMLGTPNAGCWAPMQLLSGDDPFGPTLEALTAPLQGLRTRQVLAGMPGLLQLQAGLLDGQLDQAATWHGLGQRDLDSVRQASRWHRAGTAPDDPAPLQTHAWGVPPQTVLDQAVAWRRRLDRQRDDDLSAFADRLLLVTGHARFTPDGFTWTPQGLVYQDAVDAGDGRVTLASARLPGVRTWTLDADHGELPRHARAFAAYVELLEQGDTARLQRLPAPGGEAGTPPVHVPSRPSRGRPAHAGRPAPGIGVGLGGPPPALAAEANAPVGAALHVQVVNGDLTFIQHPMLVGHYRSLSITGTEAVVDRMLGGAMRASLQAGLYPQNTGEHQLFLNTRGEPDNPWRAPRPQAAIVIGLGDEGALKPGELTATVRQAALAWSQRLAEHGDACAAVQIAATLAGSGGLGVHPGDAACAIARGVREAAQLVRIGNQQRLEDAARHAHGAGPGGAPDTLAWPEISHLTLVELYLERASDAWRALQVQAQATPGHFEVAPTIGSGVGPLRRQIDTAYRGARYDLISAESDPRDEGAILFRLDTRRARTELRAVATQAPLVRQLVRRAAQDTNDDPQLGGTLFQLLVPPDMEAYLGGTDRMVLELDHRTATLPWELLNPPASQRAGGDPRPWSVRTRLLRKLRKTQFRARVQDASADDHVLVIGEPLLRDPRYAALPGAAAEAQAVAAVMRGAQGVGAHRLRLVEHGEAATVLNALFERPWRIVHIAGHGEPGGAGGLVMSDGSFLGPREIGQMRTVPELVFVNCCHLAARDDPARGDTRLADLPAFAASVADALIEAGVRCVVAAGWAVDDDAAALFAQVLYRALLDGRPFIDAVAQAREDTWRHGDPAHGGPGHNTWAAYQCYGDPDWTFRQATGDAQGPSAASFTDALADEYEGIASPLGLALALEKLAVESRHQNRPPARQLLHVRHLQARFGALWGDMGAIAEAFGLAFSEAGDFESAIPWYGRAVGSHDGSASMKAHEQWLNLRARAALDAAKAATTPAARGQAQAELEAALQQLQALAALLPTVERLSLCGSAWKRLAMLAQQAGPPAAAAAARREAAAAYARAEALALAQGHAERSYPAHNRMATALAAHDEAAVWAGFDPATVDRLRQHLQQRCASDPDFWSMVGLVELDAFEAAAVGRLAQVIDRLHTRLHDLHTRMAAPRAWSSVADTAQYALAAWADRARGPEQQALRAWLAQLASYARG